MSWWFAASAAVQGISALTQASAASKQNKTRYETMLFNTQMEYSTQRQNAMNQQMIGQFNFAAAKQAAGLNMQLAGFNAKVIRNAADYNVNLLKASTIYNRDLINVTTEYNNLLLDTELEDLWESMELDVKLLQNQRDREEGKIVAIQSKSGTIIGDGSNADVVIDQQAQAALDELVVRHNATRGAENIRRQQARNTWEGGMAVQNLLWEGAVQQQKMLYEAELGIASTLYEGRINSANMMTQAAAQYGATMLGAQATLFGAQNQRTANLYGAQVDYAQNKTNIRSNMLTGLYGAIGTYSQNYFLQKTLASNSTGAKQLTTSYSGPIGYTGKGQAYRYTPDITFPGSSILGTSGK